MATNTQTKGSITAFAEQLVLGTNKHLSSVTQVILEGSTLTPAQVTERLQALITLRRDVDATRASTKAKLALEKSNTPALRAFLSAYVLFVKGAFANAPDVLADFGIHPKARPPVKVETKAAAAAKRSSTRAARHTMGSKQKKEVKGNVTGIVVTPVLAPHPTTAAPTDPSAPAPAGTPAGVTPRTTT